MTFKVAINGFGRIGRTILRAHYENKKKHGFEIVAVNGSGNAEDNAHFLKYDSTEKSPVPILSVDPFPALTLSSTPSNTILPKFELL
jgi:glyceraldehyde-3-phosphate dehydrogenase/erythrose-4-phosphate dehydrogenase